MSRKAVADVGCAFAVSLVVQKYCMVAVNRGRTMSRYFDMGGPVLCEMKCILGELYLHSYCQCFLALITLHTGTTIHNKRAVREIQFAPLG